MIELPVYGHGGVMKLRAFSDEDCPDGLRGFGKCCNTGSQGWCGDLESVLEMFDL